MSQRLDPDSDVTTTGWGTTPLWSKIDDGASANDADFITSNGTDPSTAETTLTNPASTPADSNTTVTLRAMVSLVDTESTALVASLYQGASLIGSHTYNYGDISVVSLTTYTFTTTNTISDFTDLRVRLVASGGSDQYKVSWVKVDVSDAAAAGATPHTLMMLGVGM
jgi:hypothetical protein